VHFIIQTDDGQPGKLTKVEEDCIIITIKTICFLKFLSSSKSRR
jgi:hypothetical protein